jgi:hypothetical protein
MLRLFLLVVGMAWLGSAMSQTFNKRFDFFNEAEGEFTLAVEVLPAGNALVFANRAYALDSLYYSSGISIVGVTTTGQFGAGYRLHIPERASYVGWVNCTSPLDTGGFVVFGGNAAANDTIKAAIYWVNIEGTVVQYHELSLPGLAWIPRGGLPTPDGGFVLVGETPTTGTDLDGFLVKTDAQGNVLWVRTYGDPDLRELLSCVEQGPWGGYYLGGQHEVSIGHYEPYIIRVDDLGYIIGQADYAAPYPSSGAYLSPASDGNVWAGGGYNVAPGAEGRRATIYKVDQDGALLWRKLYGPTSRIGLFTVQEVPGSTDLVAAGFNDSQAFGGGITGVLLRTTATGDSLWMRSYTYSDNLLTNGNSGFYDMQPTPDGGFIAVGFTYYAILSDTTYSQDVWVVKVDSMGCLEPGCHLVTGMETQITNLRGALTVAPNPVASGGGEQVRVAWPESFSAHGPLRLTLTSSDSRVVQEELVPRGVSSFQLHVSGFSPGLYHIHLSDPTRWLSGSKLIIE